MAENEQTEMQTIEILPLSPDTFRKCLIEKLRNDPDFENEKELSDDEVYNWGIENIFAEVSSACVDSDYEEIYNTFRDIGFYNDTELASLSYLEENGQADMIHTIMLSRIGNIEDVAAVINFYDVYTRYENAEINQLDKAVARLELFSSLLSDDVKGDLYFDIAKRYHGNANYQSQELKAIENTLKYTANPQTIEACKEFLGLDEKSISLSENKKNLSLVKVAYKNAIDKTEDKNTLYELHLNLANIYSKEASRPGFAYPESDVSKALVKAINHYQCAVELAEERKDRNDTKKALTELAEAQRNARRIEDWAATKCKIASLISIPKDKYNYLLRTAEYLENKRSYISREIAETALKAIKKEKLDPTSQNNLQLRAYNCLDRNTQDPTEKAKIKNNITKLENQIKAWERNRLTAIMQNVHTI